MGKLAEQYGGQSNSSPKKSMSDYLPGQEVEQVDDKLIRDVTAMLSDPEGRRTQIDNARFFSRELDMHISDAFTLRQALGRNYTGIENATDQDVAKMIEEIGLERYRPPSLEAAPTRGFFGRMWDKFKYSKLDARDLSGNIQRGPFMSVAFGHAPIEDVISEEFGTDVVNAAKKGFREAGTAMTKQLAGKSLQVGELVGNETLTQWGEMMSAAVDQYYLENPEDRIQLNPGTGVIGTTLQAITNPEILVQGTTEMTPLILEAALGHVTGVKAAQVIGKGAAALPAIGKVVAIAEPLSGQYYAEARKRGTPKEAALAQSFMQAYGEAALETWSLEANLSIFKGALGNEVKKGMAKRSTDLLLAGGKMYSRGFSEEAGQDVNAKFWELVFSDNKSIAEALRGSLTPEALEAGAFGGTLEMVMGGAAHAAGSVTRYVTMQRKQAMLSKIDSMKKVVNDNFRDEDKDSALEVLNRVEQQVKEEIGLTQTFNFETEQEAIEAYEGLVEEAARVDFQGSIERNTTKVTVNQEPSKIPSDVYVAAEEGPYSVTEQVDIEGAELLSEAEKRAEVARAEADVAIAKEAPKKAEKVTPVEPTEVVTREQERRTTVKQIKEDPTYQEVFSGLEEIAKSQDLVKRYVEPQFESEIREGYPEILKYVTFDREKASMTWDEGFESIDDFASAYSDAIQAKDALRTGKGGISAEVLRRAAEQDPALELMATKLEMLEAGKNTKEIDKQIKEYVEAVEVEDFLVERPRKTPKDSGKKAVESPEAKRVLQSAEKEIAKLRTQVNQLKADSKADKARGISIEKAKANLRLLKQKQNLLAQKEKQLSRVRKQADVRLEKSKAKAAERINRLLTAKQFKESLRSDALAMLKAIPKGEREAFINRAFQADTIGKIRKLGEQIDKHVKAFEKRNKVKELKALAKKTKVEALRPEFKVPLKKILDTLSLTTPKEETVANRDEMLDYVNQVIAETDPRSVSHMEAITIKEGLEASKAKNVNIRDLPIEEIQALIDSIQEIATVAKQDVAVREQERKAEIKRREKEIKAGITKSGVVVDENTTKKSVFDTIKDFPAKIHNNLEGLNDIVTGGRFGTYNDWSKNQSGFTKYVYKVLDDGVSKQLTKRFEQRDLVLEIIKEFNIDPDNLKKREHVFTLEDINGNAKQFSFSKSELMSIYMHTRNAHNRSVLLNNGMRRMKIGIRGTTVDIRGFTREKLDAMIDVLSDNELSFAEAIGSKLMDGMNKRAINQTSLMNDNREIATIENYWPADRGRLSRLMGQKVIGTQSLIESLGFLKERIGTGNPLRLKGFFDTVYETNQNVAAYYGLSGALREVKSVLGEPEEPGAVRNEMTRLGREEDMNRIDEHIRRIEDNSVFVDPLSGWIAKRRANFASSIFGLNAKLWIRQQISSFLISAYVDPKYIREFRGVQTAGIIKEIIELSPQMADRIMNSRFDKDIGDMSTSNERFGYFRDENTFDSLVNAIKNTDLGVAVTDAKALGLSGMKWFDINAIADIYRASKAEVADQNPNLKKDSKEFKNLLKERFEWLVRHTQPMWHVKDRSLLGSDPRPVVRTLTMFTSQREQMVRMVSNATSAWANSKSSTENNIKYAKALGAVAANIAIYAAFNIGWASLVLGKSKDAKDYFVELINAAFGSFFFSQMLTETIRVRHARSQGEWTEVDVESGLTSMANTGIDAALSYERAFHAYLEGDRDASDKLFRAADLSLDVLTKYYGLPYSSPRSLARRFEEDKENVKRTRKRRQR